MTPIEAFYEMIYDHHYGNSKEQTYDLDKRGNARTFCKMLERNKHPKSYSINQHEVTVTFK